MSRLLLDNSKDVIQRAAAATGITDTGAKRISTSSSAIPSTHLARRWKSLLIHVDNQQKQRHQLYTSSSSSPARTISPVSRKLYSYKPMKCRALSTSGSSSNYLHMENINPNFVTMEYAVRSPIAIRAAEIENELLQGVKKPFDYVIHANLGDSHAMGQKPVTFLRQLMILTFNPELIKTCKYPEDVASRACAILKGCIGGSIGAYTGSAGNEVIRKQVADFIAERDGGIPSDSANIFLTSGASVGIKSVLSLLNCEIDCQTPGIMVPIPQYPLYSATIAEYGMQKIDYYLEEEIDWSLSITELQRSYDEAKLACNPRAIVVINPGNPTGQVLTRRNIEDIIKFAHKNKLFIMADEVYQNNIFDKDSKFYSFKKVSFEMGAPYNQMELASFMSTSKGFLGECGIRGGYKELINMCPQVVATLKKSISPTSCSTTAGQVAVSALVNPPKSGEPSYEQYIEEKNAILSSLKERAELVHKILNSFEGYTANKVQGALYIFPKIDIPPKAVAAAKAKNMAADVLYAFELLESTGICVDDGSSFRQKPGTYHFRSTILPPTPVLKDMMNKLQKFHAEFMQKYK